MPKIIVCFIRIFIVYDIISTGFIQFLLKHFDCVIIDESFSNTCIFVFSLRLDVGSRKQMGKWSEISVLNIVVLKLAFTNEFARI